MPAPLVKGEKYRVVTQAPRATRYGRESVMTYMGLGGPAGVSLLFDARPVGGTQVLSAESIVLLQHVGLKSLAHYVNRKVLLPGGVR